jgi:hypothetical protein
VLDVNPGLRSRFSTTIEFHFYSPDELIAIAGKLVAEDGDRLVARRGRAGAV